jgi:hypothetical protein
MNEILDAATNPDKAAEETTPKKGTLAPGDDVPNPMNDLPPATGIQRINAMAADPEADLSEISRLIAVEIGLIIETMGKNTGPRTQTELANHVKALAQMQKTLAEADAESKKDVLNMGGPKFQYVLKRLVDCARKAVSAAVGVTDENVLKQFVLQFRDLVITEEEEIKREMNKL